MHYAGLKNKIKVIQAEGLSFGFFIFRIQQIKKSFQYDGYKQTNFEIFFWWIEDGNTLATEIGFHH